MKLIKPLLKDNYQHTLRKERSNKIINHITALVDFFRREVWQAQAYQTLIFQKPATSVFYKSTLMEGGEGVLKCFWIVEAK